MSVSDLLLSILDKLDVQQDIFNQVLEAFSKEQLPYKLIVHLMKNSNGNMHSMSMTNWDAANDVMVTKEIKHDAKQYLITCYALHI